jgi:hypothetical protein
MSNLRYSRDSPQSPVEIDCNLYENSHLPSGSVTLLSDQMNLPPELSSYFHHQVFLWNQLHRPLPSSSSVSAFSDRSSNNYFALHDMNNLLHSIPQQQHQQEHHYLGHSHSADDTSLTLSSSQYTSSSCGNGYSCADGKLRGSSSAASLSSENSLIEAILTKGMISQHHYNHEVSFSSHLSQAYDAISEGKHDNSNGSSNSSCCGDNTDVSVGQKRKAAFAEEKIRSESTSDGDARSCASSPSLTPVVPQALLRSPTITGKRGSSSTFSSSSSLGGSSKGSKSRVKSNDSSNSSSENNSEGQRVRKKRVYIRNPPINPAFRPELRILRRDIRRRYGEMFMNVMNSHDIGLFSRFVRHFCIPTCQSWEINSTCSADVEARTATPLLLAHHMGNSVEIIQRTRVLFEMVPDLTVRFSNVQVTVATNDKGSKVSADITIIGTHLFNPKDHILHSIKTKSNLDSVGVDNSVKVKEECGHSPKEEDVVVLSANNIILRNPTSPIASSKLGNQAGESLGGRQGEEINIGPILAKYYSKLPRPITGEFRGTFTFQLDENHQISTMKFNSIHYSEQVIGV